MKEIIWASEDGMKMEEKEIRAELKEEAEKYRNELLEAIVEYDDDAMNKFFEGEEIDIPTIKNL